MILFFSCHSLGPVIKPQLETIRINEKIAIEKIEEVKNETLIITENAREIETIIDNIDSIPIETKKEIKTRIDNILVATNTIEIKVDDAVMNIEKNERVVKSIEKEVTFRGLKNWIIIIVIIVVIVGIIVFKLIL
jgi:hypothetical protein